MPSPNRGDALALTFAEPVGKKPRHVTHNNPHAAEVEYDPLS